MIYEKNSHCSYCGTAFPAGTPWPRTCVVCGSTSFLNPIPVTVIAVPVVCENGKRGILVVRRSIPPRIGDLALPGGYVNLGETWQQAGAREVFEETGLKISPEEIEEFRVRSAPDGSLIIFGRARPLREADLPEFVVNEEASERKVLTQPQKMAFGLHQEVVEAFFAE